MLSQAFPLFNNNLLLILPHASEIQSSFSFLLFFSALSQVIPKKLLLLSAAEQPS
jgi:hypothetical protein